MLQTNRHKKPFRYAAGMLLFSIDKNNKLMVLLGEDSYGMLSDFGGRCEDSDISEIDTASRECYEETCGVIEDNITLKEICKRSILIKSLTFYKKPYYMFLASICFDKRYCDYFQNATNILKGLDNEIQMHSCLEKKNIKWIEWSHIKTGKVPLRNMFKNTVFNNLGEIESHIKFLFKDLRYYI